jgi:hypothetical protein
MSAEPVAAWRGATEPIARSRGDGHLMQGRQESANNRGRQMAKSPEGRTPAPAGGGEPVPAASRAEIDEFLAKVRSLERLPAAAQRGRLIFALDATMSRQPTWDAACRLQADMFLEAQAIGGLDVQLIYFRGIDECRASRWVSEPAALAALMEKIECHGGLTQIGRVLNHAAAETEKAKVQALVYVGDAMEEKIDHLCAKAGELGLRGVPAFMFQEGHDPAAEKGYREIAKLSRGAYCRFDAGAAHQLRELLRAVAAYAAGGMKALDDLSARRHAGATRLLEQMR